VSEAVFHGGDIAAAARDSGRRSDELLDFSANINPLGPPHAVRAVLRAYAEARDVERYPEPGLPDLRAALARARGVGPESIAVHAGSAALFDAIFRSLAPQRVGIPIPAFAEYRRAADACAIPVHTFALDPRSGEPFDPARLAEWIGAERLDAVVLTNPHNPLGFAVARDALLGLIAAAAQTTFVIDEAFADFDESLSLATDAARHPRIVVVRSLTKFYAMPNLRVGYAVARADRARAIARFVPAWPVSGIAATAAIAALGDTAYANGTRTANAAARAALCDDLTATGVRVLPAAANFLTFETARVAELRAQLLACDGILIRDCSSFEGLSAGRYARVAVRTPAENARLVAALHRTESSGSPYSAFAATST
jgi:threonine-phosphate decarboxylase